MAIDFEVVERRPVAGPALTLVRVNFRPVAGEDFHSNIFHQQLYPVGVRLLKSLGQLVTESGKLIAPDALGLFPEEDLADPYRRETFARNNDAEMVANIEAYWERKLRAAAEGHPYPQHHRSTLNLQVGAGADDADEAQDGFGFNSTAVLAHMASNSLASGRDIAGYRFTSVTIGQGDTINSCTADLDVINTTNDDPHLNMHLEDVDDSPNFSTDPDVNSRDLTGASSAWDATGVGTGFVTSPDFSNAMQALVDRGSWASGNAATPIFKGKTTPDAEFNVFTYDWDSASGAKLDIDFTGAAVGQPIQQRTQGIPTGSGYRDRPGRWN